MADKYPIFKIGGPIEIIKNEKQLIKALTIILKSSWDFVRMRKSIFIKENSNNNIVFYNNYIMIDFNSLLE